KRRHHGDWAKTYRAALAFALWGDPTAEPPLAPAEPALAPVRWEVGKTGLDLTVPAGRLPRAAVGDYVAQPVPRALLTGLVMPANPPPGQRVKELFYRALPVPAGIGAACPPAPNWTVVSLHAPATNTLSVLARPPSDPASHGAPAGEFHLPLVSDSSQCPIDAVPSPAPATIRASAPPAR
ncbi:MAG: hypothetical protein ACRDQZ_00670, partial [Mycobacteriales bacterium]